MVGTFLHGAGIVFIAAAVAMIVWAVALRVWPSRGGSTPSVTPTPVPPPVDDLVLCFEAIRDRINADDATVAALIAIREGISEVLMPMPSDQEPQS